MNTAILDSHPEPVSGARTSSVSWTRVAILFLRVALAAGFLSAVADRFGLWGPPGAPGVAWGDFASFTAYTGKLNSFLPAALIPVLAWVATIAEIALAVLLLIGVWPRPVAAASGALLLAFALAMTMALGIKAPLDFSVFPAAAGAFLLAAISPRDRF